MKEWILVVLEKIDMQFQGNSRIIALFGIHSIWGSQSDMFQLKYFRSNVAFLNLEKLGYWKKIDI